MAAHPPLRILPLPDLSGIEVARSVEARMHCPRRDAGMTGVPPQTTVTVSRAIAAPREGLWALWTTPVWMCAK